MKHFFIKALLVMLVVAASFILAVEVSAQNEMTERYPERGDNYCLLPDAIATASSSAPGFSPASAIDGDRVGQNCDFAPLPCWGQEGGWNDATRDTFPDWLRVDFGHAYPVSRIVVTTFQDNFSTPRIEPYLGLRVGNNYTIEDFVIEVCTDCNGPEDQNGTWVEVADVEENLDIIREFTFPAVWGTAARIVIHDSYVHYSRVIEFEAYAS